MQETKIYCFFCKRYTNHHFHAEFKPTPKTDEDTGVTNFEEYSIIQCLGCDSIRFLNSSWTSEGREDNEIVKLELTYPEDPDRFSYYVFLDEDDQSELPSMIYYLYEELMSCFRADAETLAGVGMRLMIEAVCINQKIEGRNLKDKISKLFEKGVISRNDFEVLDRLREIGNVSAHQIKSPSSSDLEAALEATNHLLRTVYIANKRTNRLRNKKME